MAVLLKLPEVREKTTFSNSTIYRLMDRGEFPRPIKVNPNGRAVAWIEEEIDAYIENRIESSRQKGVA